MIIQITKLKNFGIFKDFLWQSLPQFKEFNLIYGWNASGKTTISRIFQILESGKNEVIELEEDSICQISHSSGELTIMGNQAPQERSEIKVFNEDFVTSNLRWSVTEANPILIIGKSKIDQKKSLDLILVKLEKAKRILNTIIAKIDRQVKEKEKGLKKIRDLVIKDLNTIEGVKPASEGTSSYRTYSIASVEKLLSNGLIFPSLTDEDKLGKIKALAEKDAMRKLDKFSTNLEWVDNLIKDAMAIFQFMISKEIVNDLTKELSTNPALPKWIEIGHELHRGEREPRYCKFCKNEISKLRFEEIDQYFDKVLQNFLGNIDMTLGKINEDLIGVPEGAEKFYKEFEVEHLRIESNFFNLKKDFWGKIRDLQKKLKEKRRNPFMKINFDFDDLNKLKVALDIEIKKINELIDKHNDKSDSFQIRREETSHQLEMFIVGAFEEEYGVVDLRIKNLDRKFRTIETWTIKYQEEERKLAHLLKDHSIGADEFNKLLRLFLGRKEIFFQATDGGYLIMRNEKVATNLSEGERSAIALIFFLTKLREDGFASSDSIIVIDDPISSFDSQHIYQAFGYIKSKLKELKPKQVFILTHNFSFFRQVMNWFNHEKKVASCYMTRSRVSVQNGRFAFIDKIDPLLINHNSEYGFLFKLVYNRANSLNEVTLDYDYRLPNVVRKLLENYISFKVPIRGVQIHDKLNKLFEDYKDKEISVSLRNRVERYCQDTSHPYYQDSPSDFDENLMGELQQVCSDVISLIEQTDAVHYKYLVAECAQI